MERTSAAAPGVFEALTVAVQIIPKLTRAPVQGLFPRSAGQCVRHPQYSSNRPAIPANKKDRRVSFWPLNVTVLSNSREIASTLTTITRFIKHRRPLTHQAERSHFE